MEEGLMCREDLDLDQTDPKPRYELLVDRLFGRTIVSFRSPSPPTPPEYSPLLTPDTVVNDLHPFLMGLDLPDIPDLPDLNFHIDFDTGIFLNTDDLVNH